MAGPFARLLRAGRAGCAACAAPHRGLAIRTVVGAESCPRVGGPPPNLADVEARLAAVRARYPRAVIDRYLDRVPVVGQGALLSAGACLVGDVRLGDAAQVWYGCVLRGDINSVTVGRNSNLQDGTVVHVGDADAAVVGADVVVGHRAVIHGCVLEDACMVGMNATVLDGARVGTGSIVGAGAVVPAGMVVPPHSLVVGLPGKVVKTDIDKEGFVRALAAKYARLAHNHLRG